MATQDLTQKPYYDDYTPSKGYTHVAVQSGRVAQAREFNEIQSIMRDQVGRIGDAIFKNGKIIDGCSILVNTSARTATIAPGRIYLDGFVRLIPASAVVSISGTGTEYIGARIAPSLVTATDDSSLLDPAVDFKNYGKIGADRVKEEVQFLVMTDATLSNYTDAAKVATIVNGELQAESSSGSDSSAVVTVQEVSVNVDDAIAKRAFEEHGSYKVDGLDVFDAGASDANGISVIVTDGKAYVNGYEITKPSSSMLYIPFEKHTRTVLNEQKRFASGTMDYVLNNSPVKSIKKVSVVREVTENVVRGNVNGGSDALSNTSVVAIISVTDTANTYTEGRDYVLNGNSVDWSPISANGALEPSAGYEYTVTYRYNATLSIGSDYSLVHSQSNDGDYVNSIRFLGASMPADGTTFLVDYEYYLARIDTILLDQSGTLSVVHGVPAPLGTAVCPKNTDKTLMEVGSVLVLPGYSASSVDSELKNILASSSNNKQISPANLSDIQKRMDTMEYEEALSDLDKEAVTGESATTLRGIFTDSFIGVSKAETESSDFDCTILPEKGELVLPIDYTEYKVTPSSGSSTNAAKIGSFYLAPYSDEVALSQLYATEDVQVNPYTVYPSTPIISLSPNTDNFMAKNLFVNNDKVKRHQVHYTKWVETGSDIYEEKTGSVKHFARNGSYRELGKYGTASTEVNAARILQNKTVSYIRSNVVTVTGANFASSADNLACTVNGIAVTLTAKSGTSNGTQSGTVRANTQGKFSATFTLPANLPTSAVEVKIANSNSTATAIYYAKPMSGDTPKPVRYSTTAADPVAQSFQFTTSTILTKVGLFFSMKDTLKGVVVQIKDMVNGQPGTKVYDEVALATGEVSTSSDGSAETVVTLNRPVHCLANTPYCISILSDSASYKVWSAAIGGKDIRTQANVTAQPYTAGTMFTSTNNVAWTASAAQDMKFKLYRARFTGAAGTVTFNEVTTTPMNLFLLLANKEDFKNDGIEWQYRTASDGEWVPIAAGVDQELDGVATKYQLKASLNASAMTSATLDGSAVDLIAYKTGLTGTYVSKKVVMTGEYNAVAVSFEAALPANTNIAVQYSTDDTNWVTLEEPTIHAVDDVFSNYEYKGKLADASTNYRIRIQMTTQNQMVTPRIRRLINVLRSE